MPGFVFALVFASHSSQLYCACYYEESVRPRDRRYCFDLKQSIRYGHTVAENNDPYVRLVEEASQSTSEAAVPGAFLVDLFPSRTVLYYYLCMIVFNIPLVKYVPEWMPGAGFKTKAKEWRKLSQAMINVPYDMVKEKFVSGLVHIIQQHISTCH